MEWAELQWRAPLHAHGDVVLSLTSRSPLTVRRQVVAVHDLFVLTNPEWFSPGYVRLHQRVLRRHLRHAAGIVAVSEPAAVEIRDLARPGMPVVVAPNAASDLRATHDSGIGSQFPRPERYLLAVGNLEPRKNLVTLLDAYGLLDNETRKACPLVIVGAGAKAFGAAGIAEEPPDGVHLTGRISDRALADLYEHAHAFVSTSWAEGFGIPVVEAAQAGVGAMVLSDIPAYRWLADGPGIFFADPKSPESFASAMSAALENTTTRDLRHDIADRFSWEESTGIVADLVSSVGPGPGSGA